MLLSFGNFQSLTDSQEEGFERQQGHQLPRYNYFFFEGFQDIWKFYLRKLILNRIYSQFNDFSKVVIKDCKNNFAPDIISSCLPKSRLIILSGDKKDYLDLFFSQNRNFVKKADSSHTDKKFENLFTIQAGQWFNKKRLLLKAYDNHEPSLRLLIKSEDLEENIEEELEKIFNFLKLELSELEKINIIKKTKEYFISLNKKGKTYNIYEKNKLRYEQILKNISEIRF